MKYPVVIAPTLREAQQARRELFGKTVSSRCRFVAGNDEDIDQKLQGYDDQTFLIYGNETLYTEFFLEVLEQLQRTNRVFWFRRSI